MEELPEDYFTPTITDLKARQQHLHARAAGLNNAPLLTRAQREEQAKMKRDRWPNVRTLSFPSLRVSDGFIHVINRPRSGCASPTAHNLKKGVPVEQQDTHHICVRARLAARGRQACQIRIMYVSARLLIRRVSIHWSEAHKVVPRIASNPPPRDLKVSDPTVRDLTLGELGLAPSSILHFRFVDDGLNRACPFLRVLSVPRFLFSP